MKKMKTSTVSWFCLLFVFTWICSGFKISEKGTTWDKINTVCQKPFRSRLFTLNFKEELRKSLSVNEKYWIPARSQPTHYLYWRGCHRPTKELATLDPQSLSNNSVVSCIRKTSCSAHSSIALKGETCICVGYGDVPRYFRLYPSAVNQYCSGNLNDECGCSNGAFSLYQITKDTNKGGDCITQTLTIDIFRSRRQSGVRRCDDRNVIDSYRCWDGRTVRFFRNAVNLTWYEARRRCLQKGFELAVGSGRSTNTFLGKEFWTEMRRTFALSWTARQGRDERACVAVSKDDHDLLYLSEENCSSRHKVICDQTENSSFPVSAVVIPIVVVVVVFLVTLFIVIFERRQNLQRKLLRTVNNRFYDQVVCSSVQTTSRGQTEIIQTPAIVEEENVYHTIDDHRVDQSTDRTYAVPFQGQIVDKLNDKSNQSNSGGKKELECNILDKKDNHTKENTQYKTPKTTNSENDSGCASVRTVFQNFENHYDVTLVT